MKCRECGTENPVTRKFCRECGARLLLPCSQCGFENLPGDKFCGECGHDLRKPSEPSDRIDYSRPQSYTPRSLAEKILTSRRPLSSSIALAFLLRYSRSPLSRRTPKRFFCDGVRPCPTATAFSMPLPSVS